MFSGRFDACLRQDRISRGEAAIGTGLIPQDDSGLAAASRYASEVGCPHSSGAVGLLRYLAALFLGCWLLF